MTGRRKGIGGEERTRESLGGRGPEAQRRSERGAEEREGARSWRAARGIGELSHVGGGPCVGHKKRTQGIFHSRRGGLFKDETKKGFFLLEAL